MRGFSLVEVLVAAGILATGVLALALLLVRAVPLTLSAGRATRAVVLAADRIEQVRHTVLLANALEYLDGSGRLVDGGGGIPRGAVFVRRTRVAALPGSASAHLVIVDVEVLGSQPADVASVVGVRGAP